MAGAGLHKGFVLHCVLREAPSTLHEAFDLQRASAVSLREAFDVWRAAPSAYVKLLTSGVQRRQPK